MRRRRLQQQLFPPFLLITLLCLVLATAFASWSFRGFFLAQKRADLEAQAVLLRDRTALLLAADRLDELQALCVRDGRATGTRFTVIAPDGRVLADSGEDPAAMENHGDRTEVRGALAGEMGAATRYSATLQQEMMYVAVPGTDGAGAAFVLRAAMPLAELSHLLRAALLRVVLAGLVLGGVAALVSYGLAARIGRPLDSLRRGAERFAAGDLDHRLQAPDSEEIGALADAMNAMALQMRDRLATVERQRNELEAVLSSMVEGVLAVDTGQRILSLNAAAGRLLGLDPDLARGRVLQECLRNRPLLDLIGQAHERDRAVEGEITLHGERDRFLQAQATPLDDGAGRRIGALVVLHDVTRLRRLETVRRDFVANVSHELRTPITSIAGFVETLLEDPPADPAEARRFLEIIKSHADRLDTIIEDLLRLSRLEQEGGEGAVELAVGPLAAVVEAACAACSHKAEARRIAFQVELEPGLAARHNAPLLEQALVNLIDNAVKYSAEGGTVVITGRRADGGAALLAVRDRGPGIGAEHLPRLFERFYRVDKARSRQAGGTGLGLAIVKHIVQAHGGTVEVASTPGTGSTFTLRLPGA